jgi:hypothetical protein
MYVKVCEAAEEFVATQDSGWLSFNHTAALQAYYKLVDAVEEYKREGEQDARVDSTSKNN